MSPKLTPAVTDGAKSESQTATDLENSTDLRRLAAMIASGEVPFDPSEFDPAELQFVICEVHRHRRDRLIRFVARMIAIDIDR